MKRGSVFRIPYIQGIYPMPYSTSAMAQNILVFFISTFLFYASYVLCIFIFSVVFFIYKLLNCMFLVLACILSVCHLFT